MKTKSIFLSNWIHLVGALLFYYFVSVRHLYLQKGLNESFEIMSFLETIPTAIFPTVFGIIGYFWLIILLSVLSVAVLNVILFSVLLKQLIPDEIKRFTYTSIILTLIFSITCALVYSPVLFSVPIFIIGEIVKNRKHSKQLLKMA